MCPQRALDNARQYPTLFFSTCIAQSSWRLSLALDDRVQNPRDVNQHIPTLIAGDVYQREGASICPRIACQKMRQNFKSAPTSKGKGNSSAS
jgi:hypothetical protein